METQQQGESNERLGDGSDSTGLVRCSCPLCGAPREPQINYTWVKGLSVRAANALIQGGIQSKAEVRKLLNVNNGLRRIYKIGPSIEKEIKDWEEAQDILESALKIDRGYWPVYCSLAEFYRERERYEEAVECLKELLDLAPDYAPGYFELALVQVQAGHKRQAIDSLKQAIQHDEDMREVIEQCAAFESLKSNKKFSRLLRVE